jgi:hypothetical protein
MIGHPEAASKSRYTHTYQRQLQEHPQRQESGKKTAFSQSQSGMLFGPDFDPDPDFDGGSRQSVILFRSRKAQPSTLLCNVVFLRRTRRGGTRLRVRVFFGFFRDRLAIFRSPYYTISKYNNCP